MASETILNICSIVLTGSVVVLCGFCMWAILKVLKRLDK